MKKLFIILLSLISYNSYSQNATLNSANQSLGRALSVPTKSTQSGNTSVNTVNNIQIVNVNNNDLLNTIKSIKSSQINMEQFIYNWELPSQMKPNQGIRNNPNFNLQRQNTFINLNNAPNIKILD